MQKELLNGLLIKAYLMAWSIEWRTGFHGAVDRTAAEREPIGRLSGRGFIEYTDGAEPLTEMDTDFMLKTLDHIKVLRMELCWCVLDGTEIECKNEEE